MITGAHVLIYSTNPEADRAFVRDVLELRGIDIGQGWMIFKMPRRSLRCIPVTASSRSDTPVT
jgi:hypothetical protein